MRKTFKELIYLYINKKYIMDLTTETTTTTTDVVPLLWLC